MTLYLLVEMSIVLMAVVEMYNIKLYYVCTFVFKHRKFN